MDFKAHTQDELQKMGIENGTSYTIEYLNQDYFNGESTLERAEGTAVVNDGKIHFNVLDPYGMDKLVMKARVIK